MIKLRKIPTKGIGILLMVVSAAGRAGVGLYQEATGLLPIWLFIIGVILSFGIFGGMGLFIWGDATGNIDE